MQWHIWLSLTRGEFVEKFECAYYHLKIFASYNIFYPPPGGYACSNLSWYFLKQIIVSCFSHSQMASSYLNQFYASFKSRLQTSLKHVGQQFVFSCSQLIMHKIFWYATILYLMNLTQPLQSSLVEEEKSRLMHHGNISNYFIIAYKSSNNNIIAFYDVRETTTPKYPMKFVYMLIYLIVIWFHCIYFSWNTCSLGNMFTPVQRKRANVTKTTWW